MGRIAKEERDIPGDNVGQKLLTGKRKISGRGRIGGAAPVRMEVPAARAD
jgi:hypothetical protein